MKITIIPRTPDRKFVITSYSIHYTKLYEVEAITEEYRTMIPWPMPKLFV